MQDKIARQVHQVFGYGLELKERLERGERPHFEAEQTKLRGLLLGDSELRISPSTPVKGLVRPVPAFARRKALCEGPNHFSASVTRSPVGWTKSSLPIRRGPNNGPNR